VFGRSRRPARSGLLLGGEKSIEEENLHEGSFHGCLYDVKILRSDGFANFFGGGS